MKLSFRGAFWLSLMLLSCGVRVGKASAERELARGRRSDDLPASDVLLQQHAQQLSELTAKLTALETRLSKAEINVAFHARKSTDPFGVSMGNPIVFDVVMTNVGNAYDVHSGIFTAPLSGTYSFHLNCMDVISSDTNIGLSIMAHDTIVAQCWSQSPSGDSELAATHVALHLLAGQQVWTRSEYTESVRGSWWTVFGGYLIRADP